MLTNKRITIEAKTVVNDVEICRFLAIISNDNSKISFLTQTIDQKACKDHRDIIREDRAEFEDWAYQIQDQQTGGPEQIDILDE